MKKTTTNEPSGALDCYPSIGCRVEVRDGSEAHGDRGYVFDVGKNGVCLVELDAGCVWPVSEPWEIAVTGEKARVFEGTLNQCRQFVRANRFSVLLSSMEIRDGRVYARRNDG